MSMGSGIDCLYYDNQVPRYLIVKGWSKRELVSYRTVTLSSQGEARQCATAGQVTLLQQPGRKAELPTASNLHPLGQLFSLNSHFTLPSCLRNILITTDISFTMADSELAPKFAPFFSFVSDSQ